MVGFCGIVGDFDHDLDRVTETIVWSDREHDTRYRSDSVDLYVSTYRLEEANSQSATTDDGRRLCIWGDVLGFEGSDGYEPRGQDGVTDAEYCATLVEEHGLSFIDGLNSEFAGLILNESDGSVTLFTDRLGARPIYYTESIDGAILFSTHPRTILAHPEVEPTIDAELMVEFLTFERVFGTKTPFTEIFQLHPGSRLTYDLTNDSTSRTVYWYPEYEPVDRNYEDFVAEFNTRYQRAVEDRRGNSTDEGALISGGSDSRLLLSILGSSVVGYHMNESMNTEAKISKRVCDTVGAEFRFLKREHNYQSHVLSNVAEFQLYTSFFDQAHAVGFDEVIREEVDEIFCGQYSDTLLSGHYMPKYTVRIPPLGCELPTTKLRTLSTIDDYLQYLFTDHKFTRGKNVASPSYLDKKYNLTSIIETQIKKTENAIINHGVTYSSVENLGFTSSFYPLTNAPTYLFYYTLNQIAPTHYPYLDNRITDLALSIPHQYHTNKNIVNESLERQDSVLAQIPHSETELPLTYPEVAHTAVDLFNQFKDKIGISSDEGGAWSDHDTVVRNSDLVPEYLLKNESFPCWDEINPEQVRTIYEEHQQGENHYFDLYALLSLCNSYPFNKERSKE